MSGVFRSTIGTLNAHNDFGYRIASVLFYCSFYQPRSAGKLAGLVNKDGKMPEKNQRLNWATGMEWKRTVQEESCLHGMRHDTMMLHVLTVID